MGFRSSKRLEFTLGFCEAGMLHILTLATFFDKRSVVWYKLQIMSDLESKPDNQAIDAMGGRIALDGKKIRERRHSLGFTQEKLAQLSGISDSYVSLIETQRMRDVRGDFALGIATALEVDPVSFVLEYSKLPEPPIDQFADRPFIQVLTRIEGHLNRIAVVLEEQLPRLVNRQASIGELDSAAQPSDQTEDWPPMSDPTEGLASPRNIEPPVEVSDEVRVHLRIALYSDAVRELLNLFEPEERSHFGGKLRRPLPQWVEELLEDTKKLRSPHGMP